MKCKSSLLYTAILIALTPAVAAASAPRNTSVHSSVAAARSAAHAPIKAPTGAGVLYDQTADFSGFGLRVGEFSSSYSSYDSYGADDFVVSDSTGWTIQGFNFTAFPTQNAPMPTTAIINVYRSNVNLPGDTALCSASGIPTTYDPTSMTLGVSLPEACALPAGHYWVGFAFGEDENSSATGNWGQVTSLHNSPAVWRAPHESDTDCHNWGTFSACGFDEHGEQDYAFQVLGVVGGASGGGGDGTCADGQPTCLTLTLALDDGNAASCGSASSLQVTTGDRVNFCYTFTNASALTLNYHTLGDDIAGTFFTNRPEEVGPGFTYQFNRVVTIRGDQAPTATWQSRDQLVGYTADGSAPYDFVDISANGTPLGLGDDDSAAVTLPFSFSLYGTTSNQLCINNNGIAFFARADTCSGYYETSGIPAGGLPPYAIAPLWEDLSGGTGDVYYATVGDAPNRRFVVEWYDRSPLGGDATQGFTFETIFDEASGALSYQYQNTDVGDPGYDGGAAATVGLQYDAFNGAEFSQNTAALANASAIGWTAQATTSYTTTAQAQVTATAAAIGVAPGSIDASVAVGGTATSALTIANGGNADLDWSLATAPAATSLSGYSRYTVPQGNPFADQHAGTAPRSKARSTGARPHIPFGDAATTAYALRTGGSGGDYVRFDLSNPAAPTTIASLTNEALYGGDFIGNDFSKEYVINVVFNQLETIDTDTGATTVIGPLSGDSAFTWSGLKWDPVSDTLYAVAVDGGDSHSTRLYTVDRATAALTYVADISGVDTGGGIIVIDIAIDQAGRMYGVEIAGDDFIAIDKTTGAAEVVGSIGFDAGFAEGLDFDDSTGLLYFAGYDIGADTGNLYTINLATGHADLIAPTGNGDEFDALAIAAFGRGACTTLGDVPWLAFDQTSGAVAPAGSSTVNVTLNAVTLAPGDYSATICVTSNDPLHPSTAVPVDLHVGAGDVIFADGFDGVQ